MTNTTDTHSCCPPKSYLDENPNQTSRNQTKPAETKPNQAKPNPTKPNQTDRPPSETGVRHLLPSTDFNPVSLLATATSTWIPDYPSHTGGTATLIPLHNASANPISASCTGTSAACTGTSPSHTGTSLLTTCHIDDAAYIQLANTRIGGLSYRQSARTLSAHGRPLRGPQYYIPILHPCVSSLYLVCHTTHALSCVSVDAPFVALAAAQ